MNNLFYKDFIEKLDILFFRLDAEQKVVFLNTSCSDIFGFTAEEMLQKKFIDFIVEEDQPAIRQYMFDVMQKGGPFHRLDARIITKDKKEKILGFSLYADVDDQGRVIGAVGVGRDITEREQREEARKRAAEEWEATFNSIKDLVSIQNIDYRIVRVNKAYADAFGKSPEDFKGKLCYEIIHGTKEPIPNCPQHKSITTRKTYVVLTYEPSLGAYLEVTTSPIYNGKGEMVGAVHIAKDITERKKAEEALQASEERFRTLIANIPGAVYRCACDPDWTMEFISDTIRSISGYPSSDFINNAVRSYVSIIHPDDRTMVEKVVLDGVARKQPYIIEYRIVNSHGEACWVYQKGQGVFDKQGRLLCLDGAIFDITERKKIEKQLVQKMADLTQFKDISVDREIRMISLKKEVNKLSEMLGRRPPYDIASLDR